MEYLTCSSAPPLLSKEEDAQAFHPSKNPRSHSPAPGIVDSSCSELSELSDQYRSENITTFPPLPYLRAGETSPSAVCVSRKLSTAIATAANADHPVLAGRPTLVLPPLEGTPDKSSKTAIFHRSMPLKSPRSGPGPRPDRVKERSSTSSSRGAVAPCPDLPKPRRLHRCQSAPSVADPSYRLRNEPAPLRLDAWSEPAAENFNVRSVNYLSDRVKVPSAPSAFRLLTVDIVKSPAPIYEGLCAHPSERVQQALNREQTTGTKELPPFIFAMNLVIPGCSIYHQVSYFAIDDMKEIEQGTTPFGRLMNEFMFGESDDFRNKTFKLIPRIAEGNFVVRKAVGAKPSILGKKLKQYYVRGPRYFEMIIDIASDTVAQRVVKLALGYAKTLVVDMMFLLEGATEDRLPERIFGGVRVKFLDFRDKDGKRVIQPIS
jgi:hypothetical protein